MMLLKMNKNQKIILAIFIPIIIFFIALIIANIVGTKVMGHAYGIEYDPTAPVGEKIRATGGEIGSYETYTHNPFDLEKTWYVWMLYLIFCCIFEYKLFGDKIDK